MSMLVLIPFDLARFDSSAVGKGDDGDDEGKRLPLMERVLNVIKVYVGTMEKLQNAAAFLASKFLTR